MIEENPKQSNETDPRQNDTDPKQKRADAQGTDAVTLGPPPRHRIEQPPPSPHQNGNANKMCSWTNDLGIFVATVAGVIAVLAYTTVAAWQACLINRQLTVMNDQLDDAKQARLPFLSVKEVQIVAREIAGFRTWEIILIWENTGGTEALDISAKTTWFEVTPELTGERHVLTIPEFFLAPHLPTGASRFSISDDLLKMVRSGKKQITVQWTAIYRDKFGTDHDSASRHETRQGWILSRIDDDPGKIKINDPIKGLWIPQPDFTCVDRGCKNAKQ